MSREDDIKRVILACAAAVENKRATSEEIVAEVIRVAYDHGMACRELVPADVLRGLRAMCDFGAPHVINPMHSAGEGDITDDARAALRWLTIAEDVTKSKLETTPTIGDHLPKDWP